MIRFRMKNLKIIIIIDNLLTMIRCRKFEVDKRPLFWTIEEELRNTMKEYNQSIVMHRYGKLKIYFDNLFFEKCNEYSIILYLKKTMMMTKSVKDAEIKKIKEEEKEENKEL